MRDLEPRSLCMKSLLKYCHSSLLLVLNNLLCVELDGVLLACQRGSLADDLIRLALIENA